jgi:PHD/YefM family antitoxin component YafN of YafNO toxin-antitoxin module
MKIISSTEAIQSFNTIIASAEKEPITISNKNIAVVISSKRYQELTKLEDALYGKVAQFAITEGLSSKSEVDELLNSIG